MTNHLRVKNVLPATRCEVCHQSDCLVPETGVCTRCQVAVAELVPAGLVAQSQPVPSQVDPHLLAVALVQVENYRNREARWELLEKGWKITKPMILTTLISVAAVITAYLWILSGQFPWSIFWPLLSFLPLILFPRKEKETEELTKIASLGQTQLPAGKNQSPKHEQDRIRNNR